MQNKPTEDQINDVLNKCLDAEENGETVFPGMSYEQGVKAGIEYVSDTDNPHPFDE